MMRLQVTKSPHVELDGTSSATVAHSLFDAFRSRLPDLTVVKMASRSFRINLQTNFPKVLRAIELEGYKQLNSIK